MSIIGKMNAWWHTVLRLLHIEHAQPRQLWIQEQFTFTDDAAVNRLWYRGEPEELRQLYSQIGGTEFWATAAYQDVRRIHTGLPKEIADSIAQIVVSDMLGLECTEEPVQEQLLREITEENRFTETLSGAVTDVMVIGDGAFRLTYDPDVSAYPLIEFVPGDRVDFTRQSGRVTEVIFHTRYSKDTQGYVLHECYGYGYVRYRLTDDYGNDMPLTTLTETAELADLTFDEQICLAVPLRFWKSDRYPGRGESRFTGKRGSFDALDEAWSQFMQAVRKSQATDYIPEEFLSYDPKTGEPKKPNPFIRTFIMIKGMMGENSRNQIQTTQPQISFDGYLAAYMTALDLCLQGIISPSTLGIDVKKLDNAEAQREKEKTTLYTRNHIVQTLQDTLPQLFRSVLWMYAALYGQTLPDDLEITVPFGEYANPSFESQVETVGKAKTSRIMSNTALVEELWGDTRTSKWKAEETARLDAMDGFVPAGDEVF